MSWRNRSGVMEKSSIFERETVYLITCIFLCCHLDIVLFLLRNLAMRIFEIFIVMEKSSICDWEINMHCICHMSNRFCWEIAVS